MLESLSATVVTAFATLFGVRIAVTRLDRGDVSRAPERENIGDLPSYPVLTAPEPPGSSNGRASHFDCDNRGSNPRPGTTHRVSHYQPPKLTVVSSMGKAADIFIQWMNEEGYVGIYSASEIDSYWLACCEMLDIEPLRPKFLREALDGKSAKLGLTRLNSPQYAHIRQRTGKDRLVLYRIPRCRVAVGSEPAVPGGSPGTPSPNRQSSGIVSGNRENDSDFRRVA